MRCDLCDVQDFLRHFHIFVYVEALLYKLDRENERLCREQTEGVIGNALCKVSSTFSVQI